MGLTTLVFLAALLLSVHAETVPSRDNTIRYNCPTQQTIDTAYFGYCPADSNTPVHLRGISSSVAYSNSPQGYQTSNGDFTLSCEYDANCYYTAGGGQPLTPVDGQNPSCPTPAQTVPQPSSGVNYRRSISRRADLGNTPKYACPFDSDQAGAFITGSQIDAGDYAIANSESAGFSLGNDDLLFSCFLSSDTTCYYAQGSDGTLSFLGSFPDFGPERKREYETGYIHGAGRFAPESETGRYPGPEREIGWKAV